MDSEILEKLITTWNPHFTDPKKGGWEGTVPREKYLQRLKKLMDIRHVVILTGVRRSGKSTLMQQMVRYLIEDKGTVPQNILFLFLEDILASQYLKLGWKFLEAIYNCYLETYNPQGQVYLFLDEIQGIKEFNRWIATRYERKEPIKFIISGSRTALVDSESATVLTGRNVRIDVYPLNFYEYLLIHNIAVKGGKDLASIQDANFAQVSAILHHLGNYFFEGGYPEIVLATNDEAKRTLAATYYSDILSRDVLKPNAIRNAQEIEVLGLQIMADFTRTHTYSSLGRPQKLSIDSVKAYLEYFEKAYLFFESRHFSYKTKETQDVQRPRKIYAVDNGLRNFNIPLPRPDIGICAENIAYMELLKNNPAVYYWKGKREIDFVVMNPNLSFYNVSYTNEQAEREIQGMVEGLKEFNINEGTMLTKNYSNTKEIEGKRLSFVPLWAWLILNGKVFFKETQ